MKLFGIEISFCDADTLDVLTAQAYEAETVQQERYMQQWDTSDDDIDRERGRQAIIDTMRERNRMRERLESRGWEQRDGGWERETDDNEEEEA